MLKWWPAAKKAAVWFGFNVGAQAIPILYLRCHCTDAPEAIWEYVNCTLSLVVAVGMIFAVMSDLVTEKEKPFLVGWAGLILACLFLLAILFQVLHDEIVKKVKPDGELVLISIFVAAVSIVTSTVLKFGMWLQDAEKREAKEMMYVDIPRG